MTRYIDKEEVVKKLDEIRFGIKLKDNDTIIKELDELKNSISEYRQPYQCDTCRDYPCSAYRIGCRNCSGWK
jgi:hypothetical protein